MRVRNVLAALALLAPFPAGCATSPGFDGSYESRPQEPAETETETVTEFKTPPACSRVMELSRRIDDLWWEAVEGHGDVGDLIYEAAEAGTYRDQRQLERVMDEYGEMLDEVTDVTGQIGTLQGKRDAAANECLRE